MKKPSLWNIIWTLASIVAGLCLVVFSGANQSSFGFDIPVLMSAFGSFLVVSAFVGFWFENYSKQKFFEQIFDKVTGATSFRDAGFEELFLNSREISYSDEINKSNEIIALFTYSDGFLKRYSEELDAAIKRGAKVEFFFLSKHSSLLDELKSRGWKENSIAANYENIEKFEEKYPNKSNLKIQYYD